MSVVISPQVPFDYVVLLVTLGAMALVTLCLWLTMAPGYITRIFSSWCDGSLGRTSYLPDQLPDNMVEDPEAAGGALHVDFGMRDTGRPYQDTPRDGSHCCGFPNGALGDAGAGVISPRYRRDPNAPGGSVMTRGKASFKRPTQKKQQELEMSRDVSGSRSPGDQYCDEDGKEQQQHQQQGQQRSSSERQGLDQLQSKHLAQLVGNSDVERLRRGVSHSSSPLIPVHFIAANLAPHFVCFCY